MSKKTSFGFGYVFALAMGAVLWVTPACDRGGSTGGSAKVLKLGFVTNNASDFWKIAAAGVRKAMTKKQ
jgi:hypothetical protein